MIKLNASDQLEKFGITKEVALEFIISQLQSPEKIFFAAYQCGLTLEMLAEIVQPIFPDASEEMVDTYFINGGINAAALEPRIPNQNLYTYNQDGILVISPEPPLTENQMFFIEGLTMSAQLNLPEGEDMIWETTGDGILVHTGFGGVDYPDIIFDISASEMDIASIYMDGYYIARIDEAATALGSSFSEIDIIVENFEQELAVSDGDVWLVQHTFESVRNHYDNLIKPIYDMVMAGNTDLWI